MKQFAFFFDANKCSGCKVCAAACKDKNDLPTGRKFRKVYVMGTGEWVLKDGVHEHQKVGGYSLSISCMHCAKPACMEVCPVGAIGKREDGIVFIDQELCIGCESCASACPYGAPSFDSTTGKTSKCDFCRDTIGTNEQPACVSACMERAISYGEYEELVKKHGNISSVKPLDNSGKTKPSFVIKPHRNFNGKGEMVDSSLPEETQAYESK
jgi:anaerobic dimethyl sulfoxide reductase subunit B (iron-sulfur subunit)